MVIWLTSCYGQRDYTNNYEQKQEEETLTAFAGLLSPFSFSKISNSNYSSNFKISPSPDEIFFHSHEEKSIWAHTVFLSHSEKVLFQKFLLTKKYLSAARGSSNWMPWAVLGSWARDQVFQISITKLGKTSHKKVPFTFWLSKILQRFDFQQYDLFCASLSLPYNEDIYIYSAFMKVSLTLKWKALHIQERSTVAIIYFGLSTRS